MRNASGQQAVASKVKMSGSEKIKANMNTGNKIFGSTYDNSSIKIIVAGKFDVSAKRHCSDAKQRQRKTKKVCDMC